MGWLWGASGEWQPQVREYIRQPVKLAVSVQASLSPEFQGTEKALCSLFGASKSTSTSWPWKNKSTRHRRRFGGGLLFCTQSLPA